MKKHILILTAMLLLGSLSGWTQTNVEFTKTSIRKDKALRKVYNRFVKKGDKFYYKYERGHLMALDYYLMALQKHPNSALLNYKVADCYLHTLYKYKALPYAKKAYELNHNVMYNIDYILGRAYHQTGDFTRAISYYEKFNTSYKGTNMDSLKMVVKRIKECHFGQELLKEDFYQVINLGNEVNSEYAEYVPIIPTTLDYMLFTSRRPRGEQPTDDDKKIKGERLSGFDFEYYEDIFKSDHVNDSTWSTPYRFDYSSRKKTLHDACVSLSFDGQTIFNYRGVNNGDLFMSTLENGKWSKMVPLKGINTAYREDHIVMAYDNKTAYFISDRPGGIGGKDIWKTVKGDDGKFMEPVNLGPTVNSEYDEEGVFIHPDGKTIYFSSRGHNTMGGYDIFESTFEKGKWTQPLNMGYPVNSPDDDVFFVLTADGKTAYLSSVKPDGYGMQDIYTISTFEKKKNKQPDAVMLIGWIVDKETKDRINATVSIVDESTGEVVYLGEANTENGFITSLLTGPKGKRYTLSVHAQGYFDYTENLELFRKRDFLDLEKVIAMEKPSFATLQKNYYSILFDYNQTQLKDSYKTTLDSIFKRLQDDPELKVEIYGHADNTGWAKDNLVLSQGRAETVSSYLINKGLDRSRVIKLVGLGETIPVESNITEQGRSKNRRVECKLIK